jgi:uncharacterized membrane protein YadS
MNNNVSPNTECKQELNSLSPFFVWFFFALALFRVIGAAIAVVVSTIVVLSIIWDDDEGG